MYASKLYSNHQQIGFPLQRIIIKSVFTAQCNGYGKMKPSSPWVYVGSLETSTSLYHVVYHQAHGHLVGKKAGLVLCWCYLQLWGNRNDPLVLSVATLSTEHEQTVLSYFPSLVTPNLGIKTFIFTANEHQFQYQLLISIVTYNRFTT